MVVLLIAATAVAAQGNRLRRVCRAGASQCLPLTSVARRLATGGPRDIDCPF